MKKTAINRTYMVTALFLFCLILVSFNFPKDSLRIKNDPINDLSQHWFYDDAHGTRWFTQLPQKIPALPNQSSKIHIILPQNFETSQTLRIRSSQENFRLWLGNVLIYESDVTSPYLTHSPLASSWHFIELPSHSSGKQLTLEVTSPFKEFSGYFNTIAYGTKSNLELDLIHQYWSDLSIILLLFVSGLVLFSVPIFLKTYKKWELSYLGLFTLLISLWFFTESKMVQFFTGNHWWISSLAFILLSVFPIPLILYIRDGVMPRKKKILTLLVHGFFINTFLVIGLQYTGIYPFIKSLLITNLLMGVSVLVLTICFVQEIKHNHSPEVVYFLKSATVLFLAFGLEMLNFYFWNGFYRVSLFAKLAVWLFIALQTMNYFSQLIAFIRKSEAAELYQQLAFEDQLTQGPNRTAFERDIEAILNQDPSKIQCRLTIMDLNHLKQINDTYGHVCGDDAIKRAFKCIQSAFGHYGKSYRIGGDEFACIVYDCSDLVYENILKNLSESFEIESSALPYTLGVAVGNVIFDPEIDHHFNDFMHRADMKMYDNKPIN